MSSPTERAAAGGGAAARPESPADPPPTAPAADGGAPGDVADPGAANGAGDGQGPAGQEPDGDGGAGHADADPGPAEHGPDEAPWFLRAGRAGLAPEAVTVVAQPGDDALASLQLSARPDVTGLPPWADELPGPEPDTLPPWEAGPWPSYHPPAREPGEPAERRDRDPLAGHFADIGPFTDYGPFPRPRRGQPRF
jgi:hypothetical protein